MKKLVPTFVALVVALPLAAQAQTRLTDEQLIQLAIDRDTCEGREVIDAEYSTTQENTVIVTCGEDAAGFVPVAGLGLGGAGAAAAGLALVAAAGAGGSTNSTTNTN